MFGEQNTTNELLSARVQNVPADVGPPPDRTAGPRHAAADAAASVRRTREGPYNGTHNSCYLIFHVYFNCLLKILT